MTCTCGGRLNTTATFYGRAGECFRYRKCEDCGARYKTEERIVEKPVPDEAALQKRRAASQQRQKLRASARREAAETGEPVQAVYERWGCA